MMFFAGFWLSFVTVWTAGAAMGSPFFALFSIPFWLVGFGMVAGIIKSLVAGERLTMDRAQWALERQLLGVTWKTVKGAVADINHVDIGKTSNFMTAKGQVSECVKISSGIFDCDLGAHLSAPEQRWLLAWVQAQLDLARAERSRPAANARPGERVTAAVNAPVQARR
jgi:hypothetical protein